MRKSAHEMTMEEAFGRGASTGSGQARQAWRREREQVPEHVQEREEIDAAREWLAHVEAGRIGDKR
jgi:hypothetical protein